MRKLILVVVALVANLLGADTKVLIDAIPTGGEFAGVSPIGLPFKDAEKENPKDIEAGLNSALAGILPAGTQQGFSYICLLSAPGDQPVEIPISAAKATLKLRRTDTAVFAVFYRGGHAPAAKVQYSTASPDAKAARISTAFEKISVPPGSTTAGWIFYNLSRIQAEAEKAKSGTVFISVKGKGPLAAVPLPGLKEPLMVPEEKTVFAATWSMDPVMAATHQGEILGHPISEETAKPSSGAPK